jgi:hypothetical protein
VDEKPATRERRLRTQAGALVARWVSPERTRRATLLERLTVQRLHWDRLVQLNQVLEVVGKVATVVWIAFVATVLLGVDLKDTLQEAVNSGNPVEAALVLIIVLATFAFVAVHSFIGFIRWRIQREFWRRELAQVGRDPTTSD